MELIPTLINHEFLFSYLKQDLTKQMRFRIIVNRMKIVLEDMLDL
jgi:hypothetical protein